MARIFTKNWSYHNGCSDSQSARNLRSAARPKGVDRIAESSVTTVVDTWELPDPYLRASRAPKSESDIKDSPIPRLR